jgi:putative tryptophan/tyrosine transport system substrate-binding protein
MQRREFISLLGGAAAAWPITARAQQTALPVIGYLSVVGHTDESHDAFRRGLAETGLIDSRNVAVEYRWAEGQHDRLPALAADLVSRKVNLIAAIGASTAAKAAKAATSTIPIVFVMGDTDPVQAGVVTSLARPDGNTTGVSLMGGALGVKRVGLLRELLPNATVFAVLANPNNSNSTPDVREIEEAVKAIGLKAVVLHASAIGEFDAAFAAVMQQRASALVVTADPFFTLHRRELITRAARLDVPAIYQWRMFAADGGLMSYGASPADGVRQAGVYSGRILKGAKLTDLPILQPTKFELVINLKTAKALGLTIPPGVLAIADEVIE